MTSRKSFWCAAVFLFVVQFTRAQITLVDFSGVWVADLDAPTVNFFTPEGQGLVCRDTVSPECEEELTPFEITLNFNNTALVYEARDRIGVTDVETSAALHPSCAKDGIFPAERIITIPPSEILSYDSQEEKIYFVDPRRPDDINCMRAKYRVGENGPYIETSHAEVYQGSIPDLFALGFTFSCELPSVPCHLVVDEGNLNFTLLVQLHLTCVAGDCLNVPSASAPSPPNAQYESPVDV